MTRLEEAVLELTTARSFIDRAIGRLSGTLVDVESAIKDVEEARVQLVYAVDSVALAKKEGEVEA